MRGKEKRIDLTISYVPIQGLGGCHYGYLPVTVTREERKFTKLRIIFYN